MLCSVIATVHLAQTRTFGLISLHIKMVWIHVRFGLKISLTLKIHLMKMGIVLISRVVSMIIWKMGYYVALVILKMGYCVVL